MWCFRARRRASARCWAPSSCSRKSNTRRCCTASPARTAPGVRGLYMPCRQKKPIAEAIRQLDVKFGHMRAGLTGVLDYAFERYIHDVEPLGISYEDWVKSPEYDPAAIKHDFKAQWW